MYKKFLALFAGNVTMLKSFKIPDICVFFMFALPCGCSALIPRISESSFTGEYPVVDELMNFVKGRVASFEVASDSAVQLSTVTGLNMKLGPATHVIPDRRSKIILVATNTGSSANKFVFFLEDHINESCTEFGALAVAERHNLAQYKRDCYLC